MLSNTKEFSSVKQGRGHCSVLKIAALLVAGLAGFAQAQALPAAAPGDRPLLRQLNQEVHSLYQQTRAGLVLVEVPLPAWVAQQFVDPENPLSKWGSELSPELRRRLAHEGQGHAHRVDALVVPSSQPISAGPHEIAPECPVRPTLAMAGVVLNDRGDVLVPLYVEQNIADEQPIIARVGQQTLRARLLGADSQMNLSVFRLEGADLKASPISESRPEEGDLVMTLSPDASDWELRVWTGGRREHGLVVQLNGQVSGFCRAGQYMSLATALPITQQIIEFGRVRRAMLGVRITEVHKDDPARHAAPKLGDRPAVLVQLVLPDSPAQKAGLHNGDLILSMAGEPVGELAAFASKLASRSGKTALGVLRDSQEMTIEVELVPK